MHLGYLLLGMSTSFSKKALPDKIVLTVKTVLHGITDLHGFIRHLEGNPSNHALGKSLLHNVHQKTTRENELKLSTRKRALYLPAPFQGGHRPRKTPINHCSLPGQFAPSGHFLHQGRSLHLFPMWILSSARKRKVSS